MSDIAEETKDGNRFRKKIGSEGGAKPKAVKSHHTSESSWNRFVFFCGRLNRPAYLICLLGLFLLTLAVIPLNTEFAPLLFLRMIAGFCAWILLPGAVLCNALLPDDLKSVEIAFVVGTLQAIISVQGLFTIELLIAFHPDLQAWQSITSSIIVIAGLIAKGPRKPLDSFSFRFGKMKTKVAGMLLFGIALRLLLYFLSQGSLSPDGSLYADYARNIVQNQFNSSIHEDPAIVDLWGGSQYASHQAFIYMFAISWIILPPVESGPTLLLLLMGSSLIPLTYRLMETHFESHVALIGAFIIAVHPLFVYHSVIAYGPEMTSLVVIIFILALIQQNSAQSKKQVVLIGIAFGLVDVIWYANFYLFCLVIPLFLWVFRGFNMKLIGITMGFSVLLVIARQTFIDVPLFLIAYASILTGYVLIQATGSVDELIQLASIYAIAILTILIWRWPVQLATTYGSAFTPSSTVVNAILEPISLEITLRFLFFIGFHLTATLVLMLPLINITKHRNTNLAYGGAALIAAAGTYKVFNAFDKAVLLPAYLFSDSRFFLFVILMMVIALGSAFSKLILYCSRVSNSSRVPWRLSHTRACSVGIVLLVIIGFIPSYMTMSIGIRQVRIEYQYGWSGLPDEIQGLVDSGSIILADRARELAWLTGRMTTALYFSERGSDSITAGMELLNQSRKLGTNFFLYDSYTYAKWGTLTHLYLDQMEVGDTVLLDITGMLESMDENRTSQMEALTLVVDTEMSDVGRKSKLFRFSTNEFIRMETLNLSSAEWYTTLEGLIVHQVSGHVLTIGSGQNRTSLIGGGFSNGQTFETGHILVELEEVSATVSEIEVWNNDRTFIRTFERISNSTFFCPLGRINIDNLTITIEGEGGRYIIIRSIVIWQGE